MISTPFSASVAETCSFSCSRVSPQCPRIGVSAENGVDIIGAIDSFGDCTASAFPNFVPADDQNVSVVIYGYLRYGDDLFGQNGCIGIFPHAFQAVTVPTQQPASNRRNPDCSIGQRKEFAHGTARKACFGFHLERAESDSIKPDHAFRCCHPQIPV